MTDRDQLREAVQRLEQIASGVATLDVYGKEWCPNPLAAFRAFRNDLRAILAVLATPDQAVMAERERPVNLERLAQEVDSILFHASGNMSNVNTNREIRRRVAAAIRAQGEKK